MLGPVHRSLHQSAYFPGASVLNQVEADLFFTGEMSHHDVLRATVANNAIVCLTEHTNCERGYLDQVLKERIASKLPKDKFEILVSQNDRDPIEVLSFPL